MIEYTTWCEIRRLAESGLSVPRIAEAMGLNPKTVLKWSRVETFRPRAAPKRPSKLDPHKPQILRMVEKHPYTAQQILREVRKQGYTGGRSILQEYVAQVRPVKHKAFASLAFAPGECAQVDWGHAGSVRVGNTRRRLSFFVMTLGYSRMMYVEFTLSEQMEYFLAAHRNAFEFFGGVPEKVMVDNLKSAVLEHPRGGAPVYHPRYLDLAAHYGFEPRACNVRAPHEKGIVERAVAYVRASFLNGLEPETFGPLNPQARLFIRGSLPHLPHSHSSSLLFSPKALPLRVFPFRFSQTRTQNSNGFPRSCQGGIRLFGGIQGLAEPTRSAQASVFFPP